MRSFDFAALRSGIMKKDNLLRTPSPELFRGTIEVEPNRRLYKMNYSAIDYHKKNSFVSVVNEQGQRVAEARIRATTRPPLLNFLGSWGSRAKW